MMNRLRDLAPPTHPHPVNLQNIIYNTKGTSDVAAARVAERVLDELRDALLRENEKEDGDDWQTVTANWIDAYGRYKTKKSSK